MKTLYKHLLATTLFILAPALIFPMDSYAQGGNPADWPPVKREPHKQAKCLLCGRYSIIYNIYVDKINDAEQTLREIQIEVYEDDQFISKDKANIAAIEAADGKDLAARLATANKVLQNDENDRARHAQEEINKQNEIDGLNGSKFAALQELTNCERSCLTEEKKTSMFPGTGAGSDYFASSGFEKLNGWYAHVGLPYQQFSNNSTTFAASSTNNNYNVSTSYHPNYDLGIGYHLPGRDSNIALDYTHLYGSDTSNVWDGSLTLSPGTTGPVNWAASRVTFNYDSLDLTAGHLINQGIRFAIYYYGGLNYTRFTKDVNIWGNGLGNTVFNQIGTSYNGFGPTFGMDGYCHPFDDFPNFSFYGGVQPSLLFGTMTGYQRTTINDVLTVESIPNERLVVPVLGSKLGINYDLPYKTMKWNLQLGYRLTELFGVTKDNNSYTTPVNASFQGPYFNLGVGF